MLVLLLYLNILLLHIDWLLNDWLGLEDDRCWCNEGKNDELRDGEYMDPAEPMNKD